MKKHRYYAVAYDHGFRQQGPKGFDTLEEAQRYVDTRRFPDVGRVTSWAGRVISDISWRVEDLGSLEPGTRTFGLSTPSSAVSPPSSRSGQAIPVSAYLDDAGWVAD